MKCEEIKNKLVLLLYDEISEKQEVLEHIRRCNSCAREYEELKKIIENKPSTVNIDNKVTKQIFNSFEKEFTKSLWVRYPFLKFAPVAVAVLLVIALISLNKKEISKKEVVPEIKNHLMSEKAINNEIEALVNDMESIKGEEDENHEL